MCFQDGTDYTDPGSPLNYLFTFQIGVIFIIPISSLPWQQGFAASNPLKRFGNPKEIADTVLSLASDEASYVNGIELAVDGGMSQI